MTAFWDGFLHAITVIVPAFVGAYCGTYWAIRAERRRHGRFARDVRAMTEGMGYPYVQQHEQNGERKDWL